jgi:divalent metal cation (Fe/Co/Zn/Cd) transporter
VSQTLELTPLRRPAALSPGERAKLEHRARLLAWGGIAWHFIEFAIAIAAGVAASSIALIGFGADSLIEALAGFVVVWLFTGSRLQTPRAERRAQQLIAASFYLLAVFVSVDAIRTLVGGDHPQTSWVGIGLAAVTAPTMPLLARAKRRVGSKLNSSATVKEGAQNMVCALFGRPWATSGDGRHFRCHRGRTEGACARDGCARPGWLFLGGVVVAGAHG